MARISGWAFLGGGGGRGEGAGFWGWGRMFPPETEVGHNGFITKHKGVRHSARGGGGGVEQIKIN
jgi:hypothetical protein